MNVAENKKVLYLFKGVCRIKNKDQEYYSDLTKI